MRKYILVLVAVTLLFPSCGYLDMWSESDSVAEGTGTVDSYINFTGAAPSSVHATRAKYSGAVNVSWNSVSGADYYEVYRAEAEDTSSTSA